MPSDNPIYERARNRVATLERYLLGAAIMDLSGYMAAEVTVTFRPEWFHGPLHRSVFRAIRALIGRGARDLDVGMVIGELQSQGTFDDFAGAHANVCMLTEGSVPPPSRQSRAFRLQEMRQAWRDLDAASQGGDHGR